jgi:hypothetical protein
MLSFPLAEFIQFKLRGSALNIDLSAVISISAFLAFQPNEFSFL